MKRTPLWVFVAAVAVQVAALGLCVWAMEQFVHVDGDDGDQDEPPKAPPRREPPRPARASLAQEPEFAPVTPEPPPPEPVFGPPPAPRPESAEPAPAPAGGGSADLRYVTDVADDATQIVHGEAGGRVVAFGFYADGNIRFVDVDGGNYAGKADSARARMREAGGTRAFTVQIGIAADGRLQATFTGGLHDAETLPLEPLVGWSIA